MSECTSCSADELALAGVSHRRFRLFRRASSRRCTPGMLQIRKSSRLDRTQISHGGLWNDASFWAGPTACADPGMIAELAELAGRFVSARSGCAKRRAGHLVSSGGSTLDRGDQTARTGHALACRRRDRGRTVEGIDRQISIAAYLHAFASNQLQCAIRLSVTRPGTVRPIAGRAGAGQLPTAESAPRRRHWMIWAVRPLSPTPCRCASLEP
jgi:hypothetical protein